ncbi:MAG: fibronectin type III domain-containing protein [Chthoniobacterales bacterium]
MKLITGYSDYSADDLAHLGTDVAGNLPGLPVFTAMKPTPAQITAAVGNLTTATAMKGTGRAQAIDAAFAVLAGLLGEVATNAPQVAGVTDTQLAEIGLPIAKKPQRATVPLDACQNLVLRHGASPGEIVGRCETAGENIRTYEGQWTLDPSGATWSTPESFANSRAFKFGGLPRGKDIWVRVRARSTVGAGPWSDPATIMAV